MQAMIVIKVGNGYIVAPYTVASIPTDGVGVATKLDGGYYGGGSDTVSSLLRDHFDKPKATPVTDIEREAA